jgi:TniQ
MSRIQIGGEGTGRIEQLSSFAARYAEALDVRLIDFYRYGILTQFGRVPSNPCRLFVPAKLVIDGIGETAIKWAAALASLTGLSGLQRCSVLPFQGALASRRLVTLPRRWCPHCLEEMADGSGPVYEPLVWRICEVECCTRHLIQLVDKCPSCQLGGQTSLVANARVGCCRHCGAWLGCPISSESAAVVGRSGLAQAALCEELLLIPQKLGEEEAIASSDVTVRVLRDTFFEGSGSHMARCIGELPGQLNAYARGDYPAPLHVFLRVARVTGASMRQIFVTHDFDDTGPPSDGLFPLRRARPWKSAARDVVVGELKKAVDNNGDVSVRQVAIGLNTDPVNVWRWFPDQAKQLSQLHARRVARGMAEKKVAYMKKVRDVVFALRASGAEQPTEGDMRVLLDDPGATLNPWKRAVIAGLIAEAYSVGERAITR